jgi:hypothetical protein
MFTLATVKMSLSNAAMRIAKRDGEYRVSPMETRGTYRDEEIAYYTDDLEDALLTGLAMRRRAVKFA